MVLVLVMSAEIFADEAVIDFNRDIRPILSNNCIRCHGPDEESLEADLRLDYFEGAVEKHGEGAAIVPGEPEKSLLIQRVKSGDVDLRMPPAGKSQPLSEREISLLEKWIKGGGKYATHWSYVKPVKKEISARGPQALDYFIVEKLKELKLEMSPRASKEVLARRVAIDLTGLPPSLEMLDEFLSDDSANAYERYVDKQLASPAYGERFGSVWLDLARYADSCGYASDEEREIWPYRDWVIRAFNENKPFDQFTIEQFAGDLLPDPTDDQRIATAFHRNTKTNSEGGTNDEEFRNEAIVDRVNTTMQVWMGTTMACAQCHTHKYDPITQKEYFSFFAILNQTADADLGGDAPLFERYAPNQLELKQKLQAQLKEIKSAEYVEKQEVKKLEKQLRGIKPELSTPTMVELPKDKQRKTFVQLRGNFQALGEEVVAGTPVVFQSLKSENADRLAVGKWLVDEDNPLTSRVVVNRFWEQIFGTGLVLTSEEFGSQGDLPSHPELLDYLAVEFMEHGWDIKYLLKLLVMSETYQQSSVVSEALIEVDPGNRYYARGPRFRISAEMVRDQALFVSGLLSPKMYGPPVRPQQPDLGLKAAFGRVTDWKTSEGEDKYRRAIYTKWQRSNPYPSMTTFDAPEREVCTVRRIQTNTPLQALVTLNDPVYMEAARALARIIKEQGLEVGFRKVLIRHPQPLELARLQKLHELALADFQSGPMESEKILDAKNPDHDLAAWTVVSNVILNLDEVFMKR